MCGEDFGYYCPVCNKILKRDFGCTPIVIYHGMNLYITYCIKCGVKLAIQPINQNDGFFMKIKTAGLIYDTLINDTVNLVEKLLNTLNEDEAQEKVFKDLEIKYSKEMLLANQLELKQIIQHELCKKLIPNVKGYVYDEIKDECKNGGCIFF